MWVLVMRLLQQGMPASSLSGCGIYCGCSFFGGREGPLLTVTHGVLHCLAVVNGAMVIEQHRHASLYNLLPSALRVHALFVVAACVHFI